ncbi:60 kDa lysophospholipase [Carettochelys insculpta]|uniref:60 kDa lysophospholipase n=1 Tax=Carettochelys insculpta TaxID=44489 RepID=UPI003EB7B261
MLPMLSSRCRVSPGVAPPVPPGQPLGGPACGMDEGEIRQGAAAGGVRSAKSTGTREAAAVCVAGMEAAVQRAAGFHLGRALAQAPRPADSCSGRMMPAGHWRSSSLELGGSCQAAAEVRVLVINTGGTIGMVKEEEGLTPEAKKLVNALKKMPMLHDAEYAEKTKLYDFHERPSETLVLPLSKQNKRIVYTIQELLPLLDSSNMTTDDWAKIARELEEYYEQYDGFVILHGTDTMAYTASALSFMCENLGKTIVLTGSQVPIYELRNDGRSNLLGALLIAGQFVIPEVCLYFYHKLYRGNRVTKVDAGSFNAFSSPNLSPLANAEVDITINWETVWRANTTKKFKVHTTMNRNVGLLRIFPGITADAVRAFLQSPMEGIVLETYGTGNAPNNREDLLEELRKATKRNVVILNCTQCLRGSVAAIYATGQTLTDVGAIPGGDMTPEAALAKLSYILSKHNLSWEEKRKMLSENLRGEMTVVPTGAKICLTDSKFIQVIAKSLNVSCKEELKAIRDALIPSLACAAAKIGDTEALNAIREMGGNLSCEDYDGRTPLHIASREGNDQLVQYLLKYGATVYAKDMLGATPLMYAVKFRQLDVIRLLRETGAHLSSQELENSGTELCCLAANGDKEGLNAWYLAGANMDQTGYDGRTPLQIAEAAGHVELLNIFKQWKMMKDYGNEHTSGEKSQI